MDTQKILIAALAVLAACIVDRYVGVSSMLAKVA